MKITATIHQLHLSRDEIDTLNRVGRQQAATLDLKYQAYDDIKFDAFVPEYWQFYSEQGNIELEVDGSVLVDPIPLLEGIFSAGNDDGYGALADQYHRYTTAYSISVGDIIKLGESAWLVAGQGFTQVELVCEEVA